MEKHWTENLGNISNRPLKQTWEQIAKTLNDHIENPDSTKWSVLQPPTGSGKTQSVILYSSMLAGLPCYDHPGVLIVTRLIDDCNGIVDQINRLAGIETAVAFHSDSDIKLDELKNYPVVVITHKAYENALDYLGDKASIRQTWPFFHEWQMATRKLVVIDECIDIVESNQAGLEGLRQTLAAIPQEIREDHESDVGLIQGIVELLERISGMPGEKKDTMVLQDIDKFDFEAEVTDIDKLDFTVAVTDITGIIDALKDIPFDRQIGRNDVLERERLRQRHTKRLKDLQHILRSWSYYSGVKKDHTLHTARLLVPEDTKGAVVFDATASHNVIYQLFDDSHIVPSPDGTRNYGNVTLHVSKGHKVGKIHMKTHAKKVSGELISELNPILGEERKTLVVCHKSVEPVLSKYDTGFQMQTGHWGAIDGSNEWKDCDSAVIFGLPYRPESWTADVYMALQEPTSTEWLRDPEHRPYGDHTDIRKALMYGQIATDVIQAINRVRCRKVVDAQGNCQPTDIFILLPNDGLANELIDAIKQHMPNIKVHEWNYTGQRKKPRASKHEASLIKFIENMEQGSKFSVGFICKTLGIAPRTMDRFKAKLKASDSIDSIDSSLAKAMKGAGVILKVERKGKTQKGYFVRD